MLFRGRELLAHFHRGTSRYIIVSFIGGYHEAEAESLYFMKDYVEKYEINCIGITSRTRNLYRSDEAEALLKACRDITSRFETVVVVGQSMGSYAALKYGKILGATHIVALAPIYSLHEDDLRFDNDSLRKILAHQIVKHEVPAGVVAPGMAVRREDYQGRVLILFDPQEPNDLFFARHFRELDPDIQVLPVFYAGHALYDRINRPEVLSRLVDAALTGSPQEARRFLRDWQKTRAEAALGVLIAAARRHPGLAERALRSDALTIHPEGEAVRHHHVSSEIVYSLYERGLRKRATGLFWRFAGVRLRQPLLDPDAVSEVPGQTCLVLSWHGTYLCFDHGTKRMRFDHFPFSDDRMSPLTGSIVDDQLHLQYRDDTGITKVHLSHDEVAAVEPTERGALVALRLSTGYISAAPDNVVQADRTKILDWERFALLPVDPNHAILQPPQRDWLTRKLDVLSVQQDVTLKRDTQRKARWRSLIRL